MQVVDTTAPVIAVHGDVGPIEATSGAGAIATYVAPTWTDAVDVSGSASCSPLSGTQFALGQTIVACAAQVARSATEWAVPASREWGWMPSPLDWPETWSGWILGRALAVVGIGSLAYGWLVVAVAALRRARRLGRLRESIRRGFATAIGFVGSLFGTFWALTEAWRGYFFDPRVVPILVAASAPAWLAGCAQTVTYG